MTKSTATPGQADLFARKGSAKPAGHLITYERRTGRPAAIDPARNGTDPALSAPPGRAEDHTDQGLDDTANSGGPGSLLTIDFRRSDPASRSAAPESGPPPSAPPTPAVQRNGRDEAPSAVQRSAVAAEARDTSEPAVAPDRQKVRPEPTPAASSTGSGSSEPHSHYGLLLALFTVICLIAGVWLALNYRNLTEAPLSEIEISTALGGDKAATPNSPEIATRRSEEGPEKTGTAVAPSDETAAKTASLTDGDVRATGSQQHVEPGFDLIRIEPNGEAVIAGRAAPHSDLLLLDNGEPIGKVTANAAGEWVFIPDAPIPAGDHQFSLVVNTPQGTVTVLAPSLSSGPTPQAIEGEVQSPSDQTPAAPVEDKDAAARDETSELQAKAGLRTVEAPPLPNHKPAVQFDSLEGLAASEKAGYTIQLSSTISLSGAKQEISKLQRGFPELLNGVDLEVQKVDVDALGTRYRVRSGVFDEQSPAQALCRKFKLLDHDCLVVRRQ